MGQLFGTNAFSANAFSLNVLSTFTAIYSQLRTPSLHNIKTNISIMTMDLLGSNQKFESNYTRGAGTKCISTKCVNTK